MTKAALLIAIGVCEIWTVGAYAASSQVKVRVASNLDSPHPVVVEMFVSQEKGRFFCSTREVPKHEVKLPEQKDLTAPFKATALIHGCGETVTWNGRLACYRPGESSTIDHLLAACPTL